MTRSWSPPACTDSLVVGATARGKKEPGDTNVSDALTKPVDEKRMTNLLTMMGYAFRGGRTALAPEAQ